MIEALGWRLRWQLGAFARIRKRLAKAHRVPSRWIRPLSASGPDRLCIFVALARDGHLLPHAVDHARAWHDAGYRVVVVVASSSLDEPANLAAIDFAAAVMVRLNRGYDFGAWAAAIGAMGPAIDGANVVAIANDSVLGPSWAFGAMVARAEATDADVVGLIESRENGRHLQSFVLFFRRRALASPAFQKFWGRVGTGDRAFVIHCYEVPLRRLFAAAGLVTAALFPLGERQSINTTLDDHWRDLVAEGFPYLKVRLMRENPLGASLSEWRATAAAGGFDMAALDRQIAALQRQDGSAWSAN